MLEFTEMTAGQSQMVQLRLAEPLPLAPGDRFVLRANFAAQDQSGLITIGGGRILGTSNARLRRKKPWTLSALAARRDALDDPAQLVRTHAARKPRAAAPARVAAQVPGARRRAWRNW